jgi:hypothetical protein
VAGALFTRGNLLIQRTTGEIEEWDPYGRRLQRRLPGAGKPTGALAVTSDGTMLARLNDDGTVTFTNLASGDSLVTFSLPWPANSASSTPWRQTAMTFTADGRALLTATAGGQLIRWITAPPDLIRNICAAVGRTLTAAQWRQYAATAPPASMPCGLPAEPEKSRKIANLRSISERDTVSHVAGCFRLSRLSTVAARWHSWGQPENSRRYTGERSGRLTKRGGAGHQPWAHWPARLG